VTDLQAPTARGGVLLAPVVPVLVAASLWGTNGVVARGMFNRQVEPLLLIAMRMLLGGLSLWAVVLARGGWSLPPRRMGAVAGYALVFLSVQLTYFKSLQLAGVAVALFLQYTSPLLVAGWEGLRARQWPSPRLALALASATAGSALLVLPRGRLHVSAAGLAWGLASSTSFALLTVVAGSLRRRGVGGAVLVAWGLLLGAIFLSPLLPPWTAVASVQSADWPFFLFSGVLATGVPFALYSSALGRIRGSIAILLAMVEPVLGTALAWAVLGETLLPAQLAGCALVLASVALAAAESRK
jgi:drug/metabolite transporter (DMT)-like permease